MPFIPICLLCLSDCGPDGFLTSCNHFFCQRCAGRLPPASSSSSSVAAAGPPCPVCRRAYQLVAFSHPSIQPLFQDPTQLVNSTLKYVCNQQFHQQQVISRMREALKMLNAKYQASEQRAHEAHAALRRAEERLSEHCDTRRQQQQQHRRSQKYNHHQQQQQDDCCNVSPHRSAAASRSPSANGWYLRGQSNRRGSTDSGTDAAGSMLHVPLGWAATSSHMQQQQHQPHGGVEAHSVPPSPVALMTPGTCAAALSQQRDRPAFRLSTPLAQSLSNRRPSAGPSPTLGGATAATPTSLRALLGRQTP